MTNFYYQLRYLRALPGKAERKRELLAQLRTEEILQESYVALGNSASAFQASELKIRQLVDEITKVCTSTEA